MKAFLRIIAIFAMAALLSRHFGVTFVTEHYWWFSFFFFSAMIGIILIDFKEKKKVKQAEK
ncbi:hypothetical protein [Metabacillus idriensis]|uniref:hypothetical protein n=1 Tax=Metabacillus idriensis TaxID=324768 RepID=UPI00174B305C|nr:hypothetical protein [Metabacillus idriensis]